ncbi:MAG: alcohol dehydrogenase catalytic domain-containing protein [Thermoguttaceae bacterium]
MSMQAAFYVGNKTFRVGDAEPVKPGPGEARLRIAYCGVCGTDVHIYHGQMDRRVHIPQVIGHETSGEIVELGPGVTGFQVGDRVAVRPLQPGEPSPIDNGCSHIGQNLKFLGIDTPGAMQESWTVPAYTLHRLPASVSMQDGAVVEPVAVACHDVRLSGLREGEQVVIIGGGPIGLLIAMVARHKGGRVLIAETNPQRIALARELGFETVDPIHNDLPAAVAAFTNQAMADVVFEVSGSAAGAAVMTQLPRVRGRIVLVAIHSEPKPVELFRFFWRELKMIGVRVYEPEDFDEAIRLLGEKALPLDRFITLVAPLADIQKVFETIDRNPAGMKYLLQCTDGR